MECKFCQRTINNAGSMKAHEMSCDQNPDKIKHKTGLPKGYKHIIPSCRKGKTYDEIYGVELAENMRNKMRESLVERGSMWGRMTELEKIKFKSDRKFDMLRRYENGWVSTAGRCKKITLYNTSKQCDISVDGTWEVEVVKALNNSDLIWDRNTRRFPYTNEVGIDSHYTPDFYIETLGCYVEVKGYETEKDRCKWKSFPHKLYVLRKGDILKLKDGLTFSEVYDTLVKNFNG